MSNGKKRGLALRSLLGDETRRAALESLDRPTGSAAAALIRAALEDVQVGREGRAAEGRRAGAKATTESPATIPGAAIATAASEPNTAQGGVVTDSAPPAVPSWAAASAPAETGCARAATTSEAIASADAATSPGPAITTTACEAGDFGSATANAASEGAAAANATNDSSLATAPSAVATAPSAVASAPAAVAPSAMVAVRRAGPERQLRLVPLAQVDLARRRFQYRVSRSSSAALMESLLLSGQQVPVILRGAAPPYELVSGFGRCDALAAAVAQGRIQDAHVWADLRPELTDREAHEISVIENEEREGLSELDRVSKAKRLKEEGYAVPEIAAVLKKGERMVQYYLSLADAPRRISEALAAGTVKPTHALVLTKFAREALGEHTPGEIDARLDELLARCARGASVAELRTQLMPHRTTPRLLVPRGAGFELRGFHYSPELPEATRRELLAVLEAARARMLEGMPGAGSSAG